MQVHRRRQTPAEELLWLRSLCNAWAVCMLAQGADRETKTLQWEESEIATRVLRGVSLQSPIGTHYQFVMYEGQVTYHVNRTGELGYSITYNIYHSCVRAPVRTKML
jgi:hypothetical protein